MWKPNDLAICVNSGAIVVNGGTFKSVPHLKEGKSYKVYKVSECRCGTRVSLEEFRIMEDALTKTECTICKTKNALGFMAKRFTKLTGDDVKVETEEETIA